MKILVNGEKFKTVIATILLPGSKPTSIALAFNSDNNTSGHSSIKQ